MIITGLRFVERDGKKILQQRGIDFLGYDYDGTIGLGQHFDWFDVPVEPETYLEEQPHD